MSNQSIQCCIEPHSWREQLHCTALVLIYSSVSTSLCQVTDVQRYELSQCDTENNTDDDDNTTDQTDAHLAHVISASVDDQTSANDAVDTIQTDPVISDVDARHSIRVSQYVPQVTHVTSLIFWSTMTQLQEKKYLIVYYSKCW